MQKGGAALARPEASPNEQALGKKKDKAGNGLSVKTGWSLYVTRGPHAHDHPRRVGGPLHCRARTIGDE